VTQWEAAKSLGLSWLEQFRLIISPQAVKISIPPTIGFLVQVIKNTSLTSIIGFTELTRRGQILTTLPLNHF
jgi:polar amino acid transport system permease protein